MYCRCNLCGKTADWLVLFNYKGKTYAAARCHECVNKPEPQLNNKEHYNRIPLWYGSWAFDATSDSPPIFPASKSLLVFLLMLFFYLIRLRRQIKNPE